MSVLDGAGVHHDDDLSIEEVLCVAKDETSVDIMGRRLC
jgi:hypothetical protein